MCLKFRECSFILCPIGPLLYTTNSTTRKYIWTGKEPDPARLDSKGLIWLVIRDGLHEIEAQYWRYFGVLATYQSRLRSQPRVVTLDIDEFNMGFDGVFG
jgi:hypothetical protein